MGKVAHALVIVLASSVLISVANADLIAYWPLDEGHGLTAHDSSPNGYHGTIYGASWVGGMHGTALQFDGIGEHVDMLGSANVNVRAAITVEAWVWLNDISTGNCILTKWLPGEKSFYLYEREDSDKFNFVLWSDGDVFIADLRSSSSATVGVWTHVAATYDGSIAKLYLNGELNSFVAASGAIHQGGSIISMGTDGYGNHPFDGVIDDVRLYSHALTRDEILADMGGPIAVSRSTWGRVKGQYR
jgi:hypothetical protein